MFDQLRTQKMVYLGYLAAGIAHELNNPIGFVYANMDHLERYVRALRRRFEDEGGAAGDERTAVLFTALDGALRGARDGGARMKRAVTNLRRCSRPDRDTSSVETEEMVSAGHLVQDVVHELDDPICTVRSSLELATQYLEELKEIVRGSSRWDAEEDRIFGTLDRLLLSCRNGADRTRQIVEDLERFSRGDEAEFAKVDIHQALESTLMLLMNRYKNRIMVHREYGDLPEIGCYAGQLNQVFMNLLINAVQAIPGDGDVWISTRVEGDEAILSIRDNGRGIPPEHLNRIFDPFFTTKDPEEGTGLGLSISRDIIDRHGGTLEVESEVGKGTTFTVRLPIGEEETGDRRQEAGGRR